MASTIETLDNLPGLALGRQGRLADGNRVYIRVGYDGFPTTVEVDPEPGATVKVYGSLKDAQALFDASATGVLWDRGAVTQAALDVFPGRLETVVIETSGGAVSYEVIQ